MTGFKSGNKYVDFCQIINSNKLDGDAWQASYNLIAIKFKHKHYINIDRIATSKV